MGLILDLVGVVLIYLFGISPKLDIEGQTNRVTGEINNDESSKANNYKKLSNIGLIILFVGFLFQLLSNFLKV